ncbi:MAG: PepSY domain-containing protein [Bradyrhizobiaceae bacterium]|nr:MAG: PepSY domain-containing protein [Bradyrhizobiaceae bacterium]
MIRHIFVLVHRYANLAIAAFLIVTALTGSLLAFNSELERTFASQLFAKPRTDATRLDLATLAQRVENLVPHARLVGVQFTETDQVSASFVATKNPATGRPFELDFTQFYVDPWTGAELGRRRRGDLSQGPVNVMPFLYLLHIALVSGKTGEWILGVVALIWTIDCFIGFYLTLPRSHAAFWRHWRPAWLLKKQASSYRQVVDLHRAGGLWLWPLLFVFAWSSVMFDLRPVYELATQAVFDYESPRSVFTSLPRHFRETPQLDWRAAQTTGERLVAEQAAKHNFLVREPLGLGYIPLFGAYRYEVRSSVDVFERAPKGGSTSILFDGDSGELIRLFRPTGEHAGNTVESWLYALHMTRVFGLKFQVLVSVVGVLIAMLSVTGVLIWHRKRRARLRSRRKAPRAPETDGAIATPPIAT